MSVSRMKRLTVFAFRRDAGRLLRKLMNLRCVELRTVDPDACQLRNERIRCEEVLAQTERSLQQINEALPILRRYGSSGGFGSAPSQYSSKEFRNDGSEARAKQTVTQAISLQKRMDELQAAQIRMRGESEALLPWLDYDLPLAENETATTKTLLGSVATAIDCDALYQRLEEIGACADYVSESRQGCYFSVTYFKDREAEIFDRLAEVGFISAELPTGPLPAQQRYDAIEQEQGRMEEELVQITEQLENLAESLDQVEILSDLLQTDRTEALLHERLAQTDRCVVLEGWIPDFMQEKLESVLSKMDCAYELEDPAEEEDPPVLMRNKRFFAGFEWVVGMYSYPKYGRFDPTAIMSIFYCLIFGLMFADVGYGLLLVIACFGGIRFLHLKAGMRSMLTMFGYCGISAIIMGVIFGGWFGDLPTAIMQNLLHLPIDAGVGHFFGSGLWFNPLDDPMTFLIFSLAVGGVHLVSGMAVKFYILCKDGAAMEAVCTIIPYWVLFAGLVMLLLLPTVGGIVSVLGVLLILVFNGYGVRNPFKRLIKGLGGLYGLVNYASDLLSYSRILALALVAAVIAKVINMITLLGSTGVVGGIVMVVVLIGGHLLNLAINLLGTFVHTARLQYLEFFGKFYEDGGRPFEPILPSEEYALCQDSEDGSTGDMPQSI